LVPEVESLPYLLLDVRDEDAYQQCHIIGGEYWNIHCTPQVVLLGVKQQQQLLHFLGLRRICLADCYFMLHECQMRAYFVFLKF